MSTDVEAVQSLVSPEREFELYCEQVELYANLPFSDVSGLFKNKTLKDDLVKLQEFLIDLSNSLTLTEIKETKETKETKEK